MSKFRKIATATSLSLVFACPPAYAVGVTQSVEDALNFYHYGNKGAVKIDLNYRYENVNQDDVPPTTPPTREPNTANGNTARLRAGLLSPVFYGVQGYAEFEGNWAMQHDFNSLRNGKTNYSVIADPEKAELNQLWISYAGIPDTLIKGGRQRIKLDDDRYIGNVGWRQMETTFDSVLVTHTNQQLFGLVINAGYIGNVQTFTATTENINAPFVNVNYKIGDYGNIIGYGYWLDYTEANEPRTVEKSSETYGLRFTNYMKPGDTLKLSDNYGVVYTAEWAHQQDYGHGKTAYEADRINLMGGLTAYNVTFQGAMEQLDGKGQDKTFDTPLGTNHAFQGWADLFLVTPANGIRDLFGTAHVMLDRGNLILTGVYHDYTDDTGAIHYGDEWNFQALWKFGKHYSVLAKYAYYNADQFNTDTQKIWLEGNIKF
jgi:Alginate export